jgi:thiosulfate dehydrogenase
MGINSKRGGIARATGFVSVALAATAFIIAPHRIAAQSARQPDLAAIDRAWSDPGLEPDTPGMPTTFVPPSEADIPNDVFGETVRRGIAIFTDTRNEAKPYAGDGLNCSSCHLDRGRRPGAAPMWAAWVRYPRFRSKNDAVNTMAMRIQGCFRYSMNGTPPPEDSEVMTALQTYFFWLARGAPTGAKLAGGGFPVLPEPAGAPSSERGAAVFSGKCAACHGGDGEGRRVPGGTGYQFPPLWGPNSYNWGAGLTSVASAAYFIRANMPYGLRNVLTVEEAWDVAMFVDSHERPQDPRFTGNVAETRARFHDSKWSFYGTEQRGVLLGDPANYPLREGR